MSTKQFIGYSSICPLLSKKSTYWSDDFSILKGVKHQLIATGNKTNLVSNLNFESNIKLYKSVSDLLKEL